MRKPKTPKVVRGYVKKDGTVVNSYVRGLPKQPSNTAMYDPYLDYQQQQFLLTQTLLNNTKDAYAQAFEISTRSTDLVLRSLF